MNTLPRKFSDPLLLEAAVQFCLSSDIRHHLSVLRKYCFDFDVNRITTFDAMVRYTEVLVDRLISQKVHDTMDETELLLLIGYMEHYPYKYDSREMMKRISLLYEPVFCWISGTARAILEHSFEMEVSHVRREKNRPSSSRI